MIAAAPGLLLRASPITAAGTRSRAGPSAPVLAGLT